MPIFFHRVHRAIVITVLLSMVVACSPFQTKQPSEPAVASGQFPTEFILQGKLGIKAPNDSGSATLKWQQNAANYTINLSGPLGQKRIAIIGNESFVELHQAQGIRRAASAEELIYRETGWSIPVSQLQDWVIGQAARGFPITQQTRDEFNRFITLEQLGWSIAYSNYETYNHAAQQFSLPKKIIATREGYKLTLIVREWQL